ncbi:type I-E CRISPR-associated protein Cse2/CasB [Candidatus Foliamicus sp.]
MNQKASNHLLGAGDELSSGTKVIKMIAKQVSCLDSGPAAALRRGPLVGSGTAAFWKIVADHDIPVKNIQAWAAVVQAIAILTPIGSNKKVDKSAHEPARSMGGALSDAGISELRLARLLGAKGELRLNLTVRTCRRLARKAEHSRFDLRTLAWFLVHGTDKTDQKIARDYYRAQRRAEAKDSQTKEQ